MSSFLRPYVSVISSPRVVTDFFCGVFQLWRQNNSLPTRPRNLIISKTFLNVMTYHVRNVWLPKKFSLPKTWRNKNVKTTRFHHSSTTFLKDNPQPLFTYRSNEFVLAHKLVNLVINHKRIFRKWNNLSSQEKATFFKKRRISSWQVELHPKSLAWYRFYVCPSCLNDII